MWVSNTFKICYIYFWQSLIIQSNTCWFTDRMPNIISSVYWLLCRISTATMTEVSVNTIAAIGVCQCFPACGKGVFIFYRNSRTLFPSCLDPTRHSSNIFSRPASQAQRWKVFSFLGFVRTSNQKPPVGFSPGPLISQETTVDHRYQAVLFYKEGAFFFYL